MNNLKTQPVPHEHNWSYGFRYFRLSSDPSNMDFLEKIKDSMRAISNYGTEFGHRVRVEWQIEGNSLIIDVEAEYTSLDREVLAVFSSAGYPYNVLMMPEEQDLFLNNKILKSSVLKRIISYNNNPENVRMTKRSIEKAIDKLEYSIED